MTREFPPNSPQVVTDPALAARIAAGVRMVEQQSLFKIEEFLAAGAFGNEVGVWMEPPLVELTGEVVIISERMRVL